jgi:5'-3' exonuclease
MGIKYFFGWMKKNFASHIKTLTMNNDLSETVQVDTFLIDMNGIFHYCCQKTYQYGNFKHLADRKDFNDDRKRSSSQTQKYLFRMVGSYLDKLIAFVKPRKRVVMAVDGPAPLSKQAQQRSRRYRSARDNVDGMFDSNAITPGTMFLDHLSKYIDWHIRRRISDGTWGDIEIVFSSEKSPGEGEHKLVKFVRDHGEEKECFMMQGMDADLVMLSLATHKSNFHILRENPYRYEHEYYYINLASIREHLVNALLCEQSLVDDKIHINDFIAMIFLTGNDFLPHLPTIEILEGGIEQLFETYRMVVKQYGPLTTSVNTINLSALQAFIGMLSTSEQEFLVEKRTKPIPYPDTLLEKYTTLSRDGTYTLSFDAYRMQYYKEKMGCHNEKDITTACLKYIDGIQWVLTYYTQGPSDWRWLYPYDNAPFLSDVAKSIDAYYSYHSSRNVSDKNGKNGKPYPPFLQLLSVLPPKSRNLLPSPLSDLMMSEMLTDSYPTEFTVDMDGKMNDWEGVVQLPPLDHSLIEREYKKLLPLVDDKDKRRNFLGKSFVYRLSDTPSVFKSYYGDLNECKVSQSIIEM